VKRGNRRASAPHDGAAMSFEEIGKELGITRGGAWMAYKSAMRKLSRQCHRKQLEVIRQLAAEKGR
jgi:DNA-directed RNA polymerase specialized sigma24 family protein